MTFSKQMEDEMIDMMKESYNRGGNDIIKSVIETMDILNIDVITKDTLQVVLKKFNEVDSK